jgi:hypothetical protein
MVFVITGLGAGGAEGVATGTYTYEVVLPILMMVYG